MEGTGLREEIQESKYTVASTPSGWHLIIADRDGDWLVKPAILQVVSTAAEAIACEVEEHCMVASASGWKNGVEKWSVLHDCESQKNPLIESGVLPSAYLNIKKNLSAKQIDADKQGDSVDYLFDVPIELAHELTGFRHDQDIPGAEKEPFEVLRKTSTPNDDKGSNKPTFLKRFFGR
jgi:hypothetical protein